jgi:MFS superfamily sulfate permease-like transporter
MVEASGQRASLSDMGLRRIGREFVAGGGLISAVIPPCLAAGVLTYGPLGPAYVAAGVAAGLCCVVFAGPVAAYVAGTPWLVPTPRSSTAVIQASLLANLWRQSDQHDAHFVLAALACCILLAGLLQILFGLVGIARIVKFTPHPVLAGFLNGVALLLCLPQLGRYVHLGPHPGLVHPAMLAFLLLVVGTTVYGRKLSAKLPSSLIAIVLGVVLYYGAAVLAPGIALGPVTGAPGTSFMPALPLFAVNLPDTAARLVPMAPNILLTALSIAIVATFDTLMTLRVVQKQVSRPVRPVRDLVAVGLGNCVAALSGALAIQLSPNVSMNIYRSGPRAVAGPLIGGALLLALMVGLPWTIGAVPVVVLQATVVATGVQTFDRWSLALLFGTLLKRGRVAQRHAWHDLLVVLVVMGITASGAIIAGVLTGAALACIIFIANMSRPIFRRVYRGDEIVSKRLRPAGDAQYLLASGRKRAVIELQGVLFFGNADDLADRLAALFDETDEIALDVRGIGDIDISGAQALHEMVAMARRLEKWLVFCNVPPDLHHTIDALARPGPGGAVILPDLDSAIEWMEETALGRREAGGPHGEELALDKLDFTEGLDAAELALLCERLVERHFLAGEALCREGDAADRLWLLTKGAVSVRMAVPDRPDVRVGSLAMGTVVGEMALLGTGRRSASVVADDEVACYELDESAFRALLDEHPRLASKILANLAREMARRVRITSEYLRRALG